MADEKAMKDRTAEAQQAGADGLADGTVSNAPLDGKIIRSAPSDRQLADLPDIAQGQLHVVEEDVYQEYYLDGGNRPLYTLRFPRGTVVLKSEYDAVVNPKKEDTAPAESIPASTGGTEATTTAKVQEGRGK